jgi:hypothetical protein
VAINDRAKLELFGGKPSDDKGFKPRAKQDALGNKIPNPEEEIALVEKEIQDLRIAFEQFFLGQDRKAPLRRRDLLGERLRRFRQAGEKIPTMLRHRFDQAQSRFMSYERVWQRTLNEIEAGTYKRDVFKMKMHQRAAPPLDTDTAKRLVDWGADDQASQTNAATAQEEVTEAPTAPPPRTRTIPPPPQTQPPGGNQALSEKQLKALYNAYVTARQRTNESSDGITLDSLSKSLLKQVPTLLKKYDCKAIDFKVVIKDNRTVLKAVPRRE